MEPARSVPAQLKLRNPPQRARIPASFLAHSEAAGPRSEVDAESLVPAEDAQGRAIPEWKRQVMVRRLRARLDEAAGGQGSWRPGPFGELLSEEDLRQLEREVESLRLRRRGEEYQGELRRLAGELRALLPSPLLHLSVCSPPPAPGQPLPVWCGRLAGAVSSLAALLGRAEPGAAARPAALYPAALYPILSHPSSPHPSSLYPASPHPSSPHPTSPHPTTPHPASPHPSSYPASPNPSSPHPASLYPTSLYPPSPQPASPYPISPSPSSAAPHLGHSRGPSSNAAEREIRQCGVCVRSLRGAFEPEFRRGEVTAGSGTVSTGIPSQDALDGGWTGAEQGSLRKERIVLLFLSHWRRSAYDPTPLDPGDGGGGGTARLARQRAAIQKLLGGWRDAARRSPPPPPPPGRVPLSPEQFVSKAGGGPADYESLSLELFMLGYFRILEQELPPDERRGRHLLCFEVFEQLGRHGWRVVRAFHRAVTDEIAAGRREWRDGFEDIKARYFGSPQSSAPRPGEDGEDGDEICRYIDRSFAFWKEKEAEIFSSEE
ncbi:espin-like protein [Cuculus canorus]|uniref:espin-like protein n=1 Tax=Cuculus canorus TaxID=55661 RepID=UPI0023AABEF0|nr:espin-like protein [Cuculus canorus]